MYAYIYINYEDVARQLVPNALGEFAGEFAISERSGGIFLNLEIRQVEAPFWLLVVS